MKRLRSPSPLQLRSPPEGQDQGSDYQEDASFEGTQAAGNMHAPPPLPVAVRADIEAPAAKIVHLCNSGEDNADEQDLTTSGTMMCLLPPHRRGLIFGSHTEFETHYHKEHSNRCLECHKNFPSARLLGLHDEECHDPIEAVKRESGEHTYSCFVEGCQRKCMTPQKRRRHMIDKHGFPPNYFFAVTKEGIDGRRSLLLDGEKSQRAAFRHDDKRPLIEPLRQTKKAPQLQSKISLHGATGFEKPVSCKTDPAEMKQERHHEDSSLADLSSALSNLRFVPRSVQFVQGRKGGFSQY